MSQTPPRILLVVGAHPSAEAHDRALAYQLRDRILSRLPGADPSGILVLTDLWYLNDRELRGLPTISIGAPEVNALAAHLGDRLPSAFAIEGSMVVQMDVELAECIASCWGRDPAATAAAVDAFCQRYLDAFVEAACRAG